MIRLCGKQKNMGALLSSSRTTTTISFRFEAANSLSQKNTIHSFTLRPPQILICRSVGRSVTNFLFDTSFRYFLCWFLSKGQLYLLAKITRRAGRFFFFFFIAFFLYFGRLPCSTWVGSREAHYQSQTESGER